MHEGGSPDTGLLEKDLGLYASRKAVIFDDDRSRCSDEDEESEEKNDEDASENDLKANI